MSSEMLKVAEREMQKLREEGRREGLRAAEAEMRRIKEEGRREGLRAAQEQAREAVEDMCALLGVEVDEERRAHLAGLDLAGLQALRRHLREQRAWPSR